MASWSRGCWRGQTACRSLLDPGDGGFNFRAWSLGSSSANHFLLAAVRGERSAIIRDAKQEGERTVLKIVVRRCLTPRHECCRGSSKIEKLSDHGATRKYDGVQYFNVS